RSTRRRSSSRRRPCCARTSSASATSSTSTRPTRGSIRPPSTRSWRTATCARSRSTPSPRPRTGRWSTPSRTPTSPAIPRASSTSRARPRTTPWAGKPTASGEALGNDNDDDHDDRDGDDEKPMTRAFPPRLVAAAAGLSFALSGCAAGNAYRKGQREARKGNWDAAVAKLTLALEKDPGNIPYKIALENARIQASRAHYELGRKAMAAQDLDKAADELDIAVKFDLANKSASDDLAIVQAKIRKRDEEKKRLSEFDEMKNRVQAARLPLPVLSPRSPVPITLKFTETSLQKIFD